MDDDSDDDIPTHPMDEESAADIPTHPVDDDVDCNPPIHPADDGTIKIEPDASHNVRLVFITQPLSRPGFLHSALGGKSMQIGVLPTPALSLCSQTAKSEKPTLAPRGRIPMAPCDDDEGPGGSAHSKAVKPPEASLATSSEILLAPHDKEADDEDAPIAMKPVDSTQATRPVPGNGAHFGDISVCKQTVQYKQPAAEQDRDTYPPRFPQVCLSCRFPRSAMGSIFSFKILWNLSSCLTHSLQL
ncbi:hypothetical protein HD554DRAFT_2036404 [Boletus coccyginus]|nr:hypothetical protein HD554DRAFT_2036404 [Boletus coccyginus]